jgi:hypothetical protein
MIHFIDTLVINTSIQWPSAGGVSTSALHVCAACGGSVSPGAARALSLAAAYVVAVCSNAAAALSAAATALSAFTSAFSAASSAE